MKGSMISACLLASGFFCSMTGAAPLTVPFSLEEMAESPCLEHSTSVGDSKEERSLFCFTEEFEGHVAIAGKPGSQGQTVCVDVHEKGDGGDHRQAPEFFRIKGPMDTLGLFLMKQAGAEVVDDAVFTLETADFLQKFPVCETSESREKGGLLLDRIKQVSSGRRIMLDVSDQGDVIRMFNHRTNGNIYQLYVFQKLERAGESTDGNWLKSNLCGWAGDSHQRGDASVCINGAKHAKVNFVSTDTKGNCAYSAWFNLGNCDGGINTLWFLDGTIGHQGANHY